MKNYIIEEKMRNATDGYINVVIEGETHLNRTVISSSIQFFTTEGGYNYCHPYASAKENAQAIADGLNALEKLKHKPVINEAHQEKTINILDLIKNEVARAKTMFPDNFVNQHEGYAVMLEEVDEFWDEVKKNQKKYDLLAQKKEAIQIAAMAVRICVELLYDVN